MLALMPQRERKLAGLKESTVLKCGRERRHAAWPTKMDKCSDRPAGNKALRKLTSVFSCPVHALRVSRDSCDSLAYLHTIQTRIDKQYYQL
jgi:hypothetical protein